MFKLLELDLFFVPSCTKELLEAQSVLEDTRANTPSTKLAPLGNVRETSGWNRFLFGEEAVQQSSLTLNSCLSSSTEGIHLMPS